MGKYQGRVVYTEGLKNCHSVIGKVLEKNMTAHIRKHYPKAAVSEIIFSVICGIVCSAKTADKYLKVKLPAIMTEMI